MQHKNRSQQNTNSKEEGLKKKIFFRKKTVSIWLPAWISWCLVVCPFPAYKSTTKKQLSAIL